jgi:hypothetical protein
MGEKIWGLNVFPVGNLTAGEVKFPGRIVRWRKS